MTFSVVARSVNQEVAGHQFTGFGAHHSDYPCSYMTAAAAVGITKDDVDLFIRRLDKVFGKKRGAVQSLQRELQPISDIKRESCDEETLTAANAEFYSSEEDQLNSAEGDVSLRRLTLDESQASL